MFRRLHEPDGQSVTIDFDGEILKVGAQESVAAALLTAAPRLPFCMMGVCFDCLVEIDGVPNRQACMEIVEEGMKVRRQNGTRKLGS